MPQSFLLFMNSLLDLNLVFLLFSCLPPPPLPHYLFMLCPSLRLVCFCPIFIGLFLPYPFISSFVFDFKFFSTLFSLRHYLSHLFAPAFLSVFCIVLMKDFSFYPTFFLEIYYLTSEFSYSNVCCSLVSCVIS